MTFLNITSELHPHIERELPVACRGQGDPAEACVVDAGVRRAPIRMVHNIDGIQPDNDLFALLRAGTSTPDAVIDHLRELPTALERLEAGPKA